MIFSLVFAILAMCISFSNAFPTISITGTKFFTSDGKQFFIKGVAYQLIEDDPLVNTAQCERDASLMAQLGANSIRVYHVDASADHSGCMNAFASHGIYLWVDLDSFKTYIRLASVPSWTTNQSDSFRAVMDNFAQYENTAGFFIGNEVLNDVTDSGSAPYLLAAAADLRSYGKSKNYRTIPIGYSATDTGALPMLADYLACRPNVNERIDFYGLNSYRWCGSSTFQESGYNILLNNSANYNLPIFFTEDGCNTVPPRTFSDQAVVFGEMANAWSGAIIYEWIQETNQYGLIQYGPAVAADVNEGSSIVEGFTRNGVPTPIAPDFANLQKQWATLTPSGVDSSAYAATAKTTAPTCPSSTAGTSAWAVNPSAALPSINAVASSGMTSQLSSSIPSGRITVEPSKSQGSDAGAQNTSGSSLETPESTPNLPNTGGSVSTSTSATSSATSKAAGVRAVSSPILLDTATVLQSLLAMATLCVGAMIFL